MKIIEFRKREKISQAGLANMLDVTPACINQIEKGKRKPSPYLAKKISDLANGEIPILELLFPEPVAAHEIAQ
jgi:DNA-binding XRE family transcriptional regulator